VEWERDALSPVFYSQGGRVSEPNPA